jgi:hypothetical protein
MFKSILSFIFCLSMLTTGARADVITDWGASASTFIAAANRSGPSLILDFAVVHGAMYDAVDAYDGRYEPYATSIVGATGSPVAAAAKAARDVLVARFSAQQGTIDTTYNNYLSSHGIAADDPGIAVGAAAAAGIIALRATDGSFPSAYPPFVGGNAIGQWRPTPSYLPGNPPTLSPMAAPWLAEVTPFAVKSVSQFRSKQPPALTSSEYAQDYNEVKAMGALTGSNRTPEQTNIAYFWSDNTPIQWNRAMRAIASTYTHDLVDSARLMALLNFATADALITCWDTKRHYVFWRPVTAIHEAAADGNPATEADADWQPLINTPNYPEYSSGANNVSGAMTTILQRFFKTDEMVFTFTSNVAALPADKKTRTFTSFTAVADELVEARILLGLHFRAADTAAREQGSRVARWTFTHILKPIEDGDRDKIDRNW